MRGRDPETEGRPSPQARHGPGPPRAPRRRLRRGLPGGPSRPNLPLGGPACGPSACPAPGPTLLSGGAQRRPCGEAPPALSGRSCSEERGPVPDRVCRRGLGAPHEVCPTTLGAGPGTRRCAGGSAGPGSAGRGGRPPSVKAPPGSARSGEEGPQSPSLGPRHSGGGGSVSQAAPGLGAGGRAQEPRAGPGRTPQLRGRGLRGGWWPSLEDGPCALRDPPPPDCQRGCRVECSRKSLCE